ncbi:hypothetical protein ACWT_5664 [Actinoplanes sp. SE50]|uniref:recombination directionality factor n=1 Tax=unclassified Actinoplanes TaxID=2626549 RepID=UPI00023ED2BF|nr:MULTISPECIES: hypothetical protein [unclassified Actinoplanes]AEV86681.1 hypothetical protein ACPL_5794 [Actinoplanes sp. SE50/110]ATO85079.1 hypothetical protein ACWT_5664 [Actinoplanes sp. SE50]SLM02490.1 hypothetical protein ACSP50_5740 [Actinoplanes sp. SE50/110]
MAIKTLQQRLTQVGVIRLGQKVPTSNGNTRPGKLETLRFTSPSRPLIDAVAKLYGGEVKAWQANTGPQWEVITGVKEIPVLVPPQRIDPNMEHWGNGYRDRMCDGETETIRQRPCLCAQMQQGGRRIDSRELCKPTTRMSVMLADVPSLGTWKIESHGWNAAAELPTLAASIESAPQPIPARLEVQVREKKDFDPSKPQGKQIESKVFMVPVLHFDWLTPAQAFGGELGAAARAALGAAAVQRHAIESAQAERARPKLTAEDVQTLADEAETVKQVQDLWRDAAKDGVLTEKLQAVLKARAAELTPAPAAEKDSHTSPGSQVEVDEVVDAEFADDADAVFVQIQSVAGELRWSAAELEQRVQQFLNKSSDDADAFDLTRLLEAIKAGEVR